MLRFCYYAMPAFCCYVAYALRLTEAHHRTYLLFIRHRRVVDMFAPYEWRVSYVVTPLFTLLLRHVIGALRY